MKKEAKRKVGCCVYCGDLRELTREHVIPKCLFVPPYPKNLITVPGCDSCNNEKSKNDDFVRDFFAVDVHSSHSPVAAHLFAGKVQRSLSLNSSHLLRAMLPKFRIEPLYTSGGIYLGDFPQADFDGDRLRRALGMMVRGLYFDATRTRLPLEARVEVHRIEAWKHNVIAEVFGKLHPRGPRVLGDVFGCMFAIATEDPFNTLWALWFYERVVFAAFTESAVDVHEQVRAREADPARPRDARNNGFA